MTIPTDLNKWTRDPRRGWVSPYCATCPTPPLATGAAPPKVTRADR